MKLGETQFSPQHCSTWAFSSYLHSWSWIASLSMFSSIERWKRDEDKWQLFKKIDQNIATGPLHMGGKGVWNPSIVSRWEVMLGWRMIHFVRENLRTDLLLGVQRDFFIQPPHTIQSTLNSFGCENLQIQSHYLLFSQFPGLVHLSALSCGVSGCPMSVKSYLGSDLPVLTMNSVDKVYVDL